ncbi:ParB/RepB/Spo0J family partition protein [Candidatus Collierbacteria bacterium]|nr:ParB/RepB/Spo0J family partition protein [Candidatus Collierbacteria bacterium]
MIPAHRQVTELSIDHLQPNPLQPRGAISGDDIQELASSIREHGILEPLVVAHTPAGYQIVAGERRWRAAKIAGLATVPVIIKETSPTGMLEMALVENVQRIDLNPLERAKAFEKLMNDFSLSVADIGRRISKSSSFVSNTMRLLILPDAVKDGLISGLITEGHARALLGIPDVKEMIEVYKILLKESANVRRAEDLARRVKEKIGVHRARNLNQQFIVSDQIDMMEKNLHMVLAKTLAKTKVKLTRSRAETKLVIVLKGTPEETESTLQKIVNGVSA